MEGEKSLLSLRVNAFLGIEFDVLSSLKFSISGRNTTSEAMFCDGEVAWLPRSSSFFVSTTEIVEIVEESAIDVEAHP